jgi:hypothetical protein
VDLNEAGQRIFKHHGVLIALMTVIGLSVPLLLAQVQGEDYSASARLVIGGVDTRDGQEAAALADTALGLATTPAVIAQAVSTSGATRDQVEVALNVQVDPVGSSGVLQLTVTDSDPAVAASLAKTLATEIVQLRTDVVTGGTQTLLTETGQQIDALTQNIADIENQLAELPQPILPAQPSAAFTTLNLRHQEAVAQRAALEGQRQVLSQTLATTVQPKVIDDSAATGIAVPRALPTRLAVGALLGLLVGIALAAAVESLRPTLGRTALARQLGAPLLGHLPRRPEQDTALRDPWLANYLTLAAKEADVHSVQLVPVGQPADVDRLAGWLHEPGDGRPDVVPLVLDAGGSHDEVVTQQKLAEPGTGVVVVAPDVVRGRDLADVERYVQLTKRPVIGVITYGDARGGTRREDARGEMDAATPEFGPAARDSEPAASPAS